MINEKTISDKDLTVFATEILLQAKYPDSDLYDNFIKLTRLVCVAYASIAEYL